MRSYELLNTDTDVMFCLLPTLAEDGTRRQRKNDTKTKTNYMVLNSKPSTGIPSPERSIFEQVCLTIFSLVMTLTFDLLTAKFNKFFFVSNCI